MKEGLIGIASFLALVAKFSLEIEIPQEVLDNLTEGILLVIVAISNIKNLFTK